MLICRQVHVIWQPPLPWETPFHSWQSWPMLVVLTWQNSPPRSQRYHRSHGWGGAGGRAWKCHWLETNLSSSPKWSFVILKCLWGKYSANSEFILSVRTAILLPEGLSASFTGWILHTKGKSHVPGGWGAGGPDGEDVEDTYPQLSPLASVLTTRLPECPADITVACAFLMSLGSGCHPHPRLGLPALCAWPGPSRPHCGLCRVAHTDLSRGFSLCYCRVLHESTGESASPLCWREKQSPASSLSKHASSPSLFCCVHSPWRGLLPENLNLPKISLFLRYPPHTSFFTQL